MTRPSARLLRHAPHRRFASDNVGQARRAARRGRRSTALAQFEDEGVPRAQVRFSRFAQHAATRTRNTASRSRFPTDGDRPRDADRDDRRAFHELYEREYTYRLDAPVEFVGVHLVAIAEVGKLDAATAARSPARARRRRARASATSTTRSRAYHRADVYDGDRLEPGMEFAGPAVVETRARTIVIHPGDRRHRRRRMATCTSTIRAGPTR